jgi:hypothetical protein
MAPSSAVPDPAPIALLVAHLQDADPKNRQNAAAEIFRQGSALAASAVAGWLMDAELRDCLRVTGAGFPEMVVGVAVDPASFEKIRVAVGTPHLADVPPDQNAREFELEFPQGVRLDVLTTREPGGPGAIARYLDKFGAGIQQIEILSRDVERVTQSLRARFGLEPIYPATRTGANGTRINYFLVPAEAGKKVLIEIVEEPPRS